MLPSPRWLTAGTLITSLFVGLPTAVSALNADAAATARERPALAYLDQAEALPGAVETQLAALVGAGPPPDVTMLADDGERAIAAIGDLSTAKNIAVVVPGMDTPRSSFGDTDPKPWSLLTRAVALKQAMAERSESVAVVAFLGYRAPASAHPWEVVGMALAHAGSPALAALQQRLPDVHVTWICHSYGSLVCGGASGELGADDDLVFVGSPGTGARDADDLGPATVWAARTDLDPIGLVEFANDLQLSAFGPLPTEPSFGAHVVAAGAGGHSDYFTPGTEALAALADIATGRDPSASDSSDNEGGPR